MKHRSIHAKMISQSNVCIIRIDVRQKKKKSWKEKETEINERYEILTLIIFLINKVI